jgi:endonuclease YncB( thermonuclease family)
MRSVLIASLAILVFAAPSDADDSVKGVAQVRDAVTIAVSGARFRLSGIAPFQKQLCGGKDCAERAAEIIGPEISGHQVTCVKEHRLGHGYFLARCKRDDGVDVATLILEKGYAVPEANAQPSYREVAEKAKAEARGLWAE